MASAPHRATVDDALASITRATVERDLNAVARPRHHVTAPDGLAAVRGYVADEMRAAGLTVSLQRVAYEGASADNVIGARGDGAPIVIVGAHYDAVEGTEAADDNASGVVAVLAAARATRGFTAGATVRFVAFAFEEEGLVGSRAYVASLSAEERRRVRGALVIDGAGFSDARAGSQRMPEGIPAFVLRGIPDHGDFLGAVSSGPLREFLLRAQRQVAGMSLRVVPAELALVAPDLLRSDHAAFWEAGLPAMLASDTGEMRSPHYHQPTDTRATIDVEFLVRSARWLSAATILTAGGAP